MQTKTIWIVSQDAATPATGIRNRHYILAKEFVKKGHTVYLIAASNTHLLQNPPKVKQSYQLELVDGVHVIWVKLPYYKNAHSKQRIINWFLFAWKTRTLDKVIPEKPDAILYSSPSLIGYLGCSSLKRKFKNTRLVFEARDLWPLTMIKLGGYSHINPFILFSLWVESKAYRESDKVISCLENAVEHMTSRGMNPNKFTWVPNGFSLEENNEDLLPNNIKMQIPKDKFIIGYMGTLGLANAMESFIKAAIILKNHENIAFVVVGEGKEKTKLMNMVSDNSLKNIHFIDSIAKSLVQPMLKTFDVCFLGWENTSLYKFGVSANKTMDYFLSEKPILHAYSGYKDPIKAAHAGLSVEANNSKLIAGAILKMTKLSQSERDEMGKKGKCYAYENYEYGKLANTLSNVLLG